MQGVLIGLRIDSHRGYAQLFAGTDDAECDLTPIGNQNLSKHRFDLALLARADAKELLCKLYGMAVFDVNAHNLPFNV